MHNLKTLMTDHIKIKLKKLRSEVIRKREWGIESVAQI